jgi:hypothetical protein
LPRYRNASSFKRLISPPRVDTSSRLSTAINSISAVGGCDGKQRADDQSARAPFFDLCSKNVQIELATLFEAECDTYLT